MRLLRFLLVAVAGCLAGCQPSCRPFPSDTGVDLTIRQVTLPGGQVILAEVLFRRDDVMRGMMFRPNLATDRGLLFVHARPGKHTYWMHNVKVPLDIIWMNKDRQIVEIAANTPPCLERDPVKCPQYGGNAESRFVLELAGGMASRYGLAVGQTLEF